jgi:hypothetical protein
MHLQRLTRGADVREHVVDEEVIAVRIDSDAGDCRQGRPNRSRPSLSLAR